MMPDRSYTALVYHHPRGFYVAECLAFPDLSSEGGNAAAALAALAQAVTSAVRAGEPEMESEAIITSLSIGPRPPLVPFVSAPSPAIPTYTALVTHDASGYASYCPALGVASQGDTVDEALAMLREASALVLESRSAPEHDELVYVERITVPIADGAPIAQAS